jgi:hypothetical protein
MLSLLKVPREKLKRRRLSGKCNPGSAGKGDEPEGAGLGAGENARSEELAETKFSSGEWFFKR